MHTEDKLFFISTWNVACTMWLWKFCDAVSTLWKFYSICFPLFTYYSTYFLHLCALNIFLIALWKFFYSNIQICICIETMWIESSTLWEILKNAFHIAENITIFLTFIPQYDSNYPHCWSFIHQPTTHPPGSSSRISQDPVWLTMQIFLALMF